MSKEITILDYADRLIENLNTEADQCLNDGAEDVADLLCEASKALKETVDTLWEMVEWKPHHDSKTRGKSWYEQRALACLKSLGTAGEISKPAK